MLPQYHYSESYLIIVKLCTEIYISHMHFFLYEVLRVMRQQLMYNFFLIFGVSLLRLYYGPLNFSFP